MTAHILIIQFRVSPLTARLERDSIVRELGAGISVTCVSALDPDCAWEVPANILNGFDGVIFGGSGDFDFDGGRVDDDEARVTSYRLLEQIRTLLNYIFEHDIPTLGICFGHQIIGAYAGAIVVNDQSQKKSRSHQVMVVVDKNMYSLCAGVPDTFYAHYGHKDSLDRVPDGAVLLINGGEECKVSALCYKKNIYTTQFHPELNMADIKLRMEVSPEYLPEGVEIETVFIKDTNSNTILQNFGSFVQQKVPVL